MKKAVIVTDDGNNVTSDSPRRYEAKKTIFRFYQVVWYIVGILEILLAFRFVLKALAANPYSGFTAFIYGLSDPIVYPFNGILRTPVVGYYILEWSTLIAMAVYLVIAYIIIELLHLIKPVSPTEVEEGIDEAD